MKGNNLLNYTKQLRKDWIIIVTHRALAPFPHSSQGEMSNGTSIMNKFRSKFKFHLLLLILGKIIRSEWKNCEIVLVGKNPIF